MNEIRCWIVGLYYNLRYLSDGLMVGLVLSGHDLEYTGEIHIDHWEMLCRRCGKYVGSEIGPEQEQTNG